MSEGVVLVASVLLIIWTVVYCERERSRYRANMRRLRLRRKDK